VGKYAFENMETFLSNDWQKIRTKAKKWLRKRGGDSNKGWTMTYPLGKLVGYQEYLLDRQKRNQAQREVERSHLQRNHTREHNMREDQAEQGEEEEEENKGSQTESEDEDED